MSQALVFMVPVLGRPHRVAPLLDAIEATTPEARVLFLADPGDEAETAAIQAEQRRSLGRQLKIDLRECGGTFASKINLGVSLTSEPLIFVGADDLEPEPGWFEAASTVIATGVDLVGVNDLIERDREHATHFLMTRGYAMQPCIDGSPGPLFEGYGHWYVDDELVATAERRGAYAYCEQSRVLHLHPMAGRAADDDTYRQGRAQASRDRRLFRSRRHLWV